MGNGKILTVIANHVSAQNKYIQSARLNGKPWDKPWFSHADIAAGGALVLEMGSPPNVTWGQPLRVGGESLNDSLNEPSPIATRSDCCASIRYPNHGSGT
jgi:putative alpha-1,2-mannosidase